MTRYQEAFEAGRQWGKNYRRTHRSWPSDANVAHKAAVNADHDRAGFYYGVINGLQAFSSEGFVETFEKNARLATYKAMAIVGGVRLQVASCDVVHYQATLAYWEQIGATLLGQT